ncbi:hypothetical protein SAY86_029649 [Trapa natans]|uniref:Uncharacterized protein n=1 Tax=Trapa natans TaxID=22666 RepID=A0AAN7LWQ4_TRANT|nr:hypothetical protein SAY86_029649 [Trapa natans]
MLNLNLNCNAMAVLRRPLMRPLCSASTNINTEQLRTDLDHLHAEAKSARSKANSTRVRLLRLSEAAEKLRRQAALSIRKGKENDARELLVQKKKIMEALEKSKKRIELFDELCLKLNEAISIKETQLIGNIAMDLEVSGDDNPNEIHIVSPKDLSEIPIGSNNNDKYEDDSTLDSPVDPGKNDDMYSSEGSLDISGKSNGDLNNVREFSSYEDFLERLDGQLKNIEGELITLLRFLALGLDNAGNSEKSKIQQTLEFFESIRGIRKSISSITQQMIETI